MSIWSTPTQRGIWCGALCQECTLPITDNPEGYPQTCEDCLAEALISSPSDDKDKPKLALAE